MARLDYEQKIAIGGTRTSYAETKAIEDWTWSRVKLYSFIFACLAAAGLFLLLGYLYGGSGCYTCTKNQPTSAVAPRSQATQSPETAKEIADLKSAVEKLASKPAEPSPVPAPQAPASQATTSAASTPSVTVKIPNPLTVLVKEATPSQSQASEPQPKSCEQFSGAERLSCERWARLR